jgi:SAM-dependent methyltransferase
VAPPEPWTPERASARSPATAVLDARTVAAFASGHVEGAGRLEPHEFEPLRAELPPRDAPVLVVHDSPPAARAAAFALAALGYARVAWLDAALGALPGGLASRSAPAALWRPSPFLVRIEPRLPRGRVLDLACGSGRELVWLAGRGFEAEGWDRAPEALERASVLAERCGVGVRTRVVDLEFGPRPDPRPEYDVVMVFRFLHRPIFPWIAAWLRPGGALVYETYRTGQERYGRPKQPRFLLGSGELARAFPDCRVDLYEETEPEPGPVMARLLAFRGGA